MADHDTDELEEVRSMLAENVKNWTREWKQQGLEKGLQQGHQEERAKALGKLRATLVRELEKRFGPLPEEARQRIESIKSYERFVKLSTRAATASSLASLRLA